jgi:hypothetical protein
VYPAASRALRDRFGAGSSGGVGTIQGGALSPFLSNVYLHEFDREMLDAGLRLVRYADDWVICCRTADEARRAMELAARKLDNLGLRMHPDKTRIARFDRGLEFLGYRFDQFAANAAPVPPPKSLAAAALNESKEAVAKLRQSATGGARKAADRISSLAGRWKKGGKS